MLFWNKQFKKWKQAIRVLFVLSNQYKTTLPERLWLHAACCETWKCLAAHLCSPTPICGWTQTSQRHYCTAICGSKVAAALPAARPGPSGDLSQADSASARGTGEIQLLWFASQGTPKVQTPTGTIPAAETQTVSFSSTCPYFYRTSWRGVRWQRTEQPWQQRCSFVKRDWTNTGECLQGFHFPRKKLIQKPSYFCLFL